MRMKPTSVSLERAEEYLAHAALPLRAIYEAIDDGVMWARDVEKTTYGNMKPNPWVFASLVRFRACHILTNEAVHVGWEPADELPNCGIQVKCMPLVIRVVKSYMGGPSAPGMNRKRRLFWNQGQDPLTGLIWGNVAEPAEYRLLVDWGLNDLDQVSLAMSLPNGLWKHGQQPNVKWHRAVTFPEDGGPSFVGDEQTDIPVGPLVDWNDLRATGGL